MFVILLGALKDRLCAVALLLALSAAAHAAAPATVDIVNPRPFGHVIGDVLERVATLDVDAGYALVDASLPRAGPLDTLLEARAPAVAASARLGGTRYTIRLAYQLIGSPEAVTTLVLPAVTLVFENGGARLEETIPDWPVTMAPLTPVNVLGRAGLEQVLPDRAPVAIDTRTRALRLGLYAVAAVLILIYLAYRRYGLAWPRRVGPFARAYRDLKPLAHGGPDEAAYRAMLKHLHRAFDETAGRTVFAGELGDFLVSRPAFAGARKPIERFFEVSRLEFFAAHAAASPRVDPLALCRECRRRERGGR